MQCANENEKNGGNSKFIQIATIVFHSLLKHTCGRVSDGIGNEKKITTLCASHTMNNEHVRCVLLSELGLGHIVHIRDSYETY